MRFPACPRPPAKLSDGRMSVMLALAVSRSSGLSVARAALVPLASCAAFLCCLRALRARCARIWVVALVLLASLLTSLQSQAAPEAKLLRVDPRASLDSGHPIVTTVIEISQSKRISD